MKLCRIGSKGKEKPAIIDQENKFRDLSGHIKDLSPENLDIETINKLKKIKHSSLPEISGDKRFGSCISKPGKFIAIGLNFSDHAAESGMPVPSEPIMFMKATSSINGPNDDIEITPNSKKLDWEVELGIVIGKEAKHIDAKNSQDHIKDAAEAMDKGVTSLRGVIEELNNTIGDFKEELENNKPTDNQAN